MQNFCRHPGTHGCAGAGTDQSGAERLLPIESATVEQLVTTGLTVTAALVGWWKNNSFTPEAIKADGYLEQLRKKK